MNDTKVLLNRKDIHSLKSYLSAIYGYLQLIDKKAKDLDAADSGLNLLIEKTMKIALELESEIEKLEKSE